MMKDLCIIGANGFGREVAWLVEEINNEKKQWNLLGFIDDDKNKVGQIINGYPILGDLDYFNQKLTDCYCVIAVGNSQLREKIESKIKNKLYGILIHPGVIKSRYVTIGEGTIICAGNILTTNIKIGNHVIVNLDCTIGHDVQIENFVTILPSVNISGNVLIKALVNIGTGTAIIQGKNIGQESIIGAGSVIVKDIPEKVTVVGVPGKIIKYNGDK